MAHYAFINEENIVVEVITGKDEDDTDSLPSDYASWEEYYESKRDNLTCKRTSYWTHKNVHIDDNDKTAFRGNFAGINSIYDTENDVFYPPQPYASWVIDESTWSWEAPIEQPTLTEDQINDGAYYEWNEEAYQNDNTTGWDLIE